VGRPPRPGAPRGRGPRFVVALYDEAENWLACQLQTDRLPELLAHLRGQYDIAPTDETLPCEGCGPVPPCGRAFKKADGVSGVPGYPAEQTFCPECAGTLKAAMQMRLVVWPPAGSGHGTQR
jgi:hypothetical protein